MLISIIIILLAFTWLIMESDFLRVRLPVGKTELKQEPILLLKAPGPETIFECSPDVIQFCENGDAREFYKVLNNLSKQEIVITDNEYVAKTKVQTLKIGHGVYSLALLKQLINNLPENTTINLQSLKAVDYDGYKTIPALKCTWLNHVARGSWTLKSGYEIKFYRIDGDYKYDELTQTSHIENIKVKASRHNMNRDVLHLLPNDWMAAINYM